MCTLLQRGAAVAGHASPARGVPGSQRTPAPSALHPPGPRQVSETFHIPPAHVSSSNPPGAQATASFASFAAQALPAAGGPDGCTTAACVGALGGGASAALAAAVGSEPASGWWHSGAASAPAVGRGAVQHLYRLGRKQEHARRGTRDGERRGVLENAAHVASGTSSEVGGQRSNLAMVVAPEHRYPVRLTGNHPVPSPCAYGRFVACVCPPAGSVSCRLRPCARFGLSYTRRRRVAFSSSCASRGQRRRPHRFRRTDGHGVRAADAGVPHPRRAACTREPPVGHRRGRESGKVLQALVERGQAVTSGEVIATLDARSATLSTARCRPGPVSTSRRSSSIRARRRVRTGEAPPRDGSDLAGRVRPADLAVHVAAVVGHGGGGAAAERDQAPRRHRASARQFDGIIASAS